MRDGLYKDQIGNQSWYRYGLRHRLDGPALVTSRGDQFWYQEGKLHREDGPAIIYKSGSQEWWFYDKFISYKKEEFESYYKTYLIQQNLQSFL